MALTKYKLGDLITLSEEKKQRKQIWHRRCKRCFNQEGLY